MKLQGVTTTGIYCRADCVARPNAENVRSVPHGVGALAAGFRPCLRCRPDQLPGLGLPPSAPSEIIHALRLITDGFLNTKTTDQLAQRVGYSPRHLVRLFQDHLGASPDFVARALRAHLARRLLDDSHLSITQIAFAAGFSSLRQMNRVIRDLFGFSPSELRAKVSGGKNRGAIDGGLRLRIPYSGQVAVGTLIHYLDTRAIDGVESVEKEVYRRTTTNCGAPAVVEICQADDDAHLEVTLHLASFDSILEQVGRVRSLFGLDWDSTHAEHHLKQDPALRPLVRATPGLRMPGSWDPFETALRVIVGQQVSVAGASTVTGRLATRFGRPIDAALPGSLRTLFPTPQELAEALDPVPKDLSMPMSRARTIARFSEAVAAGDLDLTRVTPRSELIERLEQIPGIGPWTSNLIAARAGRDPDAFPAGDLGLRRAAAAQLKRSDISERELQKYAERWRPYRATAAAYLWLGKKNSKAGR